MMRIRETCTWFCHVGRAHAGAMDLAPGGDLTSEWVEDVATGLRIVDGRLAPEEPDHA